MRLSQFALHNGHHGIYLVEWDGSKWRRGVPLGRADQG